MVKTLLTLLLLSFAVAAAGADTLRIHRQIQWEGSRLVASGGAEPFVQLRFAGAQYEEGNPALPVYSERIPMAAGRKVEEVRLERSVYGIPEDDLNLPGLKSLPTELSSADQVISCDRETPYLIVSFLPIRQNPYNGSPEILLEFDLVILLSEDSDRESANAFSYADHSVLATGKWYKIGTDKDGIHKLTYNDLQSFGMDVQSLDPRNIRIYGNGGGMLSETLSDNRPDDLLENPIFVSGENDGKFDPGDYILFYGESPHRWVFDAVKGHFNHRQHIYSDLTAYFITSDLGPGRRVAVEPSVTDPSTVAVTSFTDRAYHERDIFNLINAGRVWFGEVFDIKTTFDTTFIFPDILTGEQGYVKAYVAARAGSSSSFRIYHGSSQILSCPLTATSSTEVYADDFSGDNTFFPASSELNISVVYQKPESSATGWLNYLELNVVRKLRFTGPQMAFRSPVAVGEDAVAEFTLENAGAAVTVWNVTDPATIVRQAVSQNGSSQVFRARHDELQEFIAFDGSEFLTARFIGQVDNQDLHSLPVPDLLILSHKDFLDQAERLAQFHRELDGMSVAVVDVSLVYNEFSSGVQDITAIRNFVKMLYDRGLEHGGMRYLLLFGDASFDYKDRITGNSNYVPTWEGEESLKIIASIATDDYYGFMDGPGDNQLDIGIGRFPVQTSEQAVKAVDKVIHYATNTPVVMHDWRNVIAFVADDEDGNMHLDQAEELAAKIDTAYPAYNVDKIYVDAFPQYATSGGQRAPDVNKAINSRIGKGTLVINFTGHGGEVGWGHERFLEISDIDSWTNRDPLPVFITATCEFSRYDDPERVSAGEMVFNNPSGGAIAMFTTARATYGGSNFNLNEALFSVMFEQNQGEYYRFGDLIRISKNVGGVVDNDRKFVLLGDPALKLAYPEHRVEVTSINGAPVGSEPDTLRALSTVQVTGRITDQNSVQQTGFQGTLYSIVFDKPSSITTLKTDDGSRPAVFELQNNILYKGKAEVSNGEFSFSFIVPKDISYQYGVGKISFYAASQTTDANGFYNNLVIGGFEPGVDPDEEGPEIDLYMNDELFVFGGMTDENPVLYARVRDESGINTVGSGIGHDIVAILDGNTDKPFILNEYYEAEVNSYTSGTVRYQFIGLEPGLHSVSLKVWDVFNNSGEAYIEFNVSLSDEFHIGDLKNYPNPFTGGTNITFAHNQAETELQVTLMIHDLTGRLVRAIEADMLPSGYRSEPVYWDGSDAGGARVAKGLYLYRVFVRRPDGKTLEESAKMIKMD